MQRIKTFLGRFLILLTLFSSLPATPSENSEANSNASSNQTSPACDKVLTNLDLNSEIRQFLSLTEIAQARAVNHVFNNLESPILWSCPRTIHTRGLVWLARYRAQVSRIRCLRVIVQSSPIDTLGLLSLQQATIQSRLGQILQGMRELSSLTLIPQGETLPVTSARALFSALPSLSGLEDLSIDFRRISFGQRGIFRDMMISSLANTLAQLSSIRHLRLNLSSSRANIETLARVLESVSALTQLESLELELGQNPALQILPGQSFASVLSRLPSLRHLRLSLSGNRLSHRALQTTLTSLASAQNLESLSLDLSRNHVNTLSLRNLANSLRALRGLESLDLRMRYSSLQLPGLSSLARAIGGPHQLRRLELDLRNNRLEDEAFFALNQGIRNLQHLEHFSGSFSQNMMTSSSLRSIASTFPQLSALRNLSITLSSISGANDQDFRDLHSTLSQYDYQRLELQHEDKLAPVFYQNDKGKESKFSKKKRKKKKRLIGFEPEDLHKKFFRDDDEDDDPDDSFPARSFKRSRSLGYRERKDTPQSSSEKRSEKTHPRGSERHKREKKRRQTGLNHEEHSWNPTRIFFGLPSFALYGMNHFRKRRAIF